MRKLLLLFALFAVAMSDTDWCHDMRRACHRCKHECHHHDYLRKLENTTTCPATVKETINCLLESIPAVDVDID